MTQTDKGAAARVVANVHFTNQYGGAHNRIIRSASKLRELGYEIEFWLPETDGRAAEIAATHGMCVRRMPFHAIENVKGITGYLKLLFSIPRDIFRFWRSFRGNRVALVHVNGGFFVSPAIAAWLARKPVVWHLNDTVLKPVVAWSVGRVVRLFATRIIAQGHAVGSFYRLQKSNYDCIYSLVDTESFKPETEPVRGRPPFRVGLIASRNPMKGMDSFISAVVKLKTQTGLPVTGVLAGARLASQVEYGEYLDRLVEEARESVEFEDYDFVESPENLLVTLDVLVMASPYGDACPNIVLEAMSCGVPVVSVSTGSVAELLQPNCEFEAGIVVPRSEPQALADAMGAILEEPGRASRMSRNGRERAVAEFSIERYAQAHDSVYIKAMSP